MMTVQRADFESSGLYLLVTNPLRFRDVAQVICDVIPIL